MTTQFKSPKLCMVVAPSALLTASSTDALSCRAVTRAALTPTKSLAELTRDLVAHPHDEVALCAVRTALRDGGDIEELVALLEACANGGLGDGLPEPVVAQLTFRIAEGSDRAHARELCRTALDLCPTHGDALSLFEELADDAAWTEELCARYQIFLEDAAEHDVAPELCEAVSHKLAKAERRATLHHRQSLSSLHDSARVPQALLS